LLDKGLQMIFEQLDSLTEDFHNKAYEKTVSQIKTITFRPCTIRTPHSYLMLSAHQLKHLNKLDSTLSDAVMINLEDGVAPEFKPMARAMAALFISNIKERKSKIIVRVNPLDEGGIDDIKVINQVKPDAIRVAKIRSISEAKQAVALIDPEIEIHFSIETASAFKLLTDLRVDERVTTFYLGILDLLADMKLPQNIVALGNATFETILAQFLLGSHIAQVTPVGFTYQAYKNLLTYEAYTKLQQKMGYTAFSCISPGQVKIVNRIFKEKNLEREKAKKVIALFEAHQKKGVTGFSDPEFGFIDEPIYKGALVTLNL
jgi:citrate lyase subunit beta / citryl-CoA lyase